MKPKKKAKAKPVTLNLNVRHCQVLKYSGPDVVLFAVTDVEPSMPAMTDLPEIAMRFEVSGGRGIDYVFDNFPSINRIELIDPSASPPTRIIRRKDRN